VLLLGSNTVRDRCTSANSSRRNGHPYKFVDLDSDADSQAMLDQFHVRPATPLVICRGTVGCAIHDSTVQTVSG